MLLKSLEVKTNIPEVQRLEDWSEPLNAVGGATFNIRNIRILIPLKVKIVGTQTMPSEPIIPRKFLDFETNLLPREEREVRFNVNGGRLITETNTINIQVKSSIFGLGFRTQFRQVWNTPVATRSFSLLSTGKMGAPINWINVIDTNTITGNPPNLNTNKLVINGSSSPFSITMIKRVQTVQTTKVGDEEQVVEFVQDVPFKFSITQVVIGGLAIQNASITVEIFEIA